MKKKIKLSHSEYFQRQFQRGEFAISFFKEYLPKEITKRIDWVSLRLAAGDFVGKALRHRRSDILYEARIEDKDAMFYIHLEHQRSPHKKMAFRMLIYTVRIWEQFESQYPKKDLPLIYPMVVYQGKRRWTAPLTIHEMLEVPEYMKPFCPQLTYGLMDLSSFSDEDIQGEIFQRLALLVMRNIDSPDINQLLFDKYLPLLIELVKRKRGVEYIEDMLYYLIYKSQHLDKDLVIERLASSQETENLQEAFMTLAEKWEQQGIEKGINQGINQGIDQGKINLVSKLLIIKFRDEAREWTGKLNQLSTEKLDLIAERILTANTLSQVFQGLFQ